MKKILIAFMCFYAGFVTMARDFKVAFIGDPQVDNLQELDYARKSIYKELSGREDLDLAIILGDLVNDNSCLLAASKAIIDSLPFPCLTIPGNHDFDIYQKEGKSRDLATYERVFGRPDTTFTAAGVRFILMNNVRITDHRGYEGGFSESQKEWLDSLLNLAGPRQVVIATHIPVSHSSGRDSVYSMMSSSATVHSGRKLVLVSGHTHSVARHNMVLPGGEIVPEILAGATCGSWWRGVKDSNGIPYAIQNCGAPRGYFVASFKKYRMALTYKAVASDDIASAYIVDDTTLVVNVYGGAADGKLTARAKGRNGTRIKLERKETVAPEILSVIRFNSSMSREERRTRRDEFIPARRLKSPHIWVGNIPFSIREGASFILRYDDEQMQFRSKVRARNTDE